MALILNQNLIQRVADLQETHREMFALRPGRSTKKWSGHTAFLRVTRSPTPTATTTTMMAQAAMFSLMAVTIPTRTSTRMKTPAVSRRHRDGQEGSLSARMPSGIRSPANRGAGSAHLKGV